MARQAVPLSVLVCWALPAQASLAVARLPLAPGQTTTGSSLCTEDSFTGAADPAHSLATYPNVTAAACAPQGSSADSQEIFRALVDGTGPSGGTVLLDCPVGAAGEFLAGYGSDLQLPNQIVVIITTVARTALTSTSIPPDREKSRLGMALWLLWLGLQIILSALLVVVAYVSLAGHFSPCFARAGSVPRIAAHSTIGGMRLCALMVSVDCLGQSRQWGVRPRQVLQKEAVAPMSVDALVSLFLSLLKTLLLNGNAVLLLLTQGLFGARVRPAAEAMTIRELEACEVGANQVPAESWAKRGFAVQAVQPDGELVADSSSRLKGEEDDTLEHEELSPRCGKLSTTDSDLDLEDGTWSRQSTEEGAFDALDFSRQSTEDSWIGMDELQTPKESVEANVSEDILLETIPEDGDIDDALSDAPDALRQDKDFVIEAVRKNYRVLEWASTTLREDREVVLAAVRENGAALQYAPMVLREDKGLLEEAYDSKHPCIYGDRERFRTWLFTHGPGAPTVRFIPK